MLIARQTVFEILHGVVLAWWIRLKAVVDSVLFLTLVARTRATRTAPRTAVTPLAAVTRISRAATPAGPGMRQFRAGTHTESLWWVGNAAIASPVWHKCIMTLISVPWCFVRVHKWGKGSFFACCAWAHNRNAVTFCVKIKIHVAWYY